MEIVNIAYMLLLVFALVIIVKNQNALKQQLEILHAIRDYNMHCIETNEFSKMIEVEEMEAYEATLFRLWDWGCTRILPPEKFELVKPYLQKGNNK